MSMAKWTWIKNASDLPAPERYCTHCRKPLRGAVVMLELNCTTGKWSDGGVPADQSQGWFPVGSTCADKIAHPLPA